MTDRNDGENDAKSFPPRRKRSGVVGRTKQADQATAQIGDRLRKIYNDVVDEPIPDDFKALLDQLDEKEES
jgi:hypothetical protein